MELYDFIHICTRPDYPYLFYLCQDKTKQRLKCKIKIKLRQDWDETRSSIPLQNRQITGIKIYMRPRQGW